MPLPKTNFLDFHIPFQLYLLLSYFPKTSLICVYVYMCIHIYIYYICNLICSPHYFLLCLLSYTLSSQQVPVLFSYLCLTIALHLTRLVSMSIGCLIKGNLPVATLKHIILLSNIYLSIIPQ